MFSCIHLSAAHVAGLAFASFFLAQRPPFESFLAVCPGSWCVRTPSQINRRTRTCACSPRSGDVRVSNSCVVRKSVVSGHVQRGLPADLGPVLAVSAGYVHTCAVRSDGQLVCFGRHSDVPADLGPVLAISAGVYQYQTCAVRLDGELVGIGYNKYGSCDAPVPEDLGPVSAISASRYHA